MEKVILVDEHDRPIGLEEKARAHQGRGVRHRAFSVFIFNGKGEFLLQRRSARKMLWPLFWTNTCCSHPKEGEDYQTAGQRRLKEEMGFTCQLKNLGSFAYEARYQNVGSENELCSVLVGAYDGPVAPDPAEVADYAWVDFEKLKKRVAEHPDEYTPWFTLELARFFEADSKTVRGAAHAARNRKQSLLASARSEMGKSDLPISPRESFTNARQFLFDEIVYNGHLQTWGAVALVALDGQLLNAPVRLGLLAAAYLLFYLIYLHDRYRGALSDALGNARRSEHVQKISRFVPAILFVGLALLAVFLLIFSNAYALGFFALVALGGFLYPLAMKGLTQKIVAFKNAYVALVFSALVVFPNVYYGVPFTARAAALAAFLALFIFLRGMLMQFLLDLKDIDGDRLDGLRTLGVVWGKEKTLAFIGRLNILVALLVPFAYFLSAPLLPPSALSLTLTALWYGYAVSLVRRGNPAGFILEGAEFVAWPLLVFFAGFIV